MCNNTLREKLKSQIGKGRGQVVVRWAGGALRTYCNSQIIIPLWPHSAGYTRTLYSSFNVQVWLGCRQMLYIGERTPLAVVCIEYALWFRINKCIFHLNRFFFLLPHEYSVIYNKNCCSFNQCCKSTQHLF